MSILRPYNSKELMDEYKETGLEFRHHDTQISAANRLMLPPLVIGLLVLYGEVDKFLGVEFKNPEAARLLIWSGCMIISLIWVFNVSRTGQLVHSHLDTRRKNAEIFGLRGHTKIFIMDRDSGFSKIFRHNKLRLVGFGIYFFLLLRFKLKSTILDEAFIWLIAIGLSIVLSSAIWFLYFGKLPRLSRKTSNLISTICIVLVPVLLALLILLVTPLSSQPDANAHLMRGLKYAAEGDYAGAIEEYTKAIKIKPDYAKAYALRGEAHRAKGEDDQSNKDWGMVKALREGQ